MHCSYSDACGAFAAFPLAPVLLSRVAGSCEEAGQHELAARALTDLCRDFPDTKEGGNGLLRLGRLRLRLNQPQQAAQIFTDFLSRYPDSEWRAQVERLLSGAQTKGD